MEDKMLQFQLQLYHTIQFFFLSFNHKQSQNHIFGVKIIVN